MQTKNERTLYSMKQRNSIYLACDEMDFTWGINEVHVFDEMWKEGKPMKEIARVLERKEHEVAILAVDRASKGKVKLKWNA